MQRDDNLPKNYRVQARIPYFEEQAFKVSSQDPLFRKIVTTWSTHAQVNSLKILAGEYGQEIEVPLFLIQNGFFDVERFQIKIVGKPIFLKQVQLSYRQQMKRLRRQIAAKTENQHHED